MAVCLWMLEHAGIKLGLDIFGQWQFLTAVDMKRNKCKWNTDCQLLNYHDHT